MSKERPFAPDKHHQWASFLAILRAAAMFGSAPLKTQSLRCFQMLQAPRMMMEFKPFLTSPVVAASAFSHQSSQDESLGWGVSEESPTRSKRENQNYLAKMHLVGAECFPVPGHKADICLGGEVLTEQACQQSNTSHGRPATWILYHTIFMILECIHPNHNLTWLI